MPSNYGEVFLALSLALGIITSVATIVVAGKVEMTVSGDTSNIVNTPVIVTITSERVDPFSLGIISSGDALKNETLVIEVIQGFATTVLRTTTAGKQSVSLVDVNNFNLNISSPVTLVWTAGPPTRIRAKTFPISRITFVNETISYQFTKYDSYDNLVSDPSQPVIIFSSGNPSVVSTSTPFRNGTALATVSSTIAGDVTVGFTYTDPIGILFEPSTIVGHLITFVNGTFTLIHNNTLGLLKTHG